MEHTSQNGGDGECLENVWTIWPLHKRGPFRFSCMYPMECFPLTPFFSFLFLPNLFLRSSIPKNVVLDIIISPVTSHLITVWRLKSCRSYSFFPTHTHTQTPPHLSYSKRLLVGQLKTSCLWIMTPRGHILCVRHVGFHDWRTCECRGWRCRHYSHLRRLRGRLN